MTHTKIMIAVSFAAVLSLSHVHSQPPPPQQPPKPPSKEERWQHVSEKINKELTLTPQQKEKIKMAYTEFFDKMDGMRQRPKDASAPPPPPPPPPGKKEEMDKVVKMRDEKIKGVLNAAQFKKYQEIEKTLHPPRPPMNR